MDRKFEPVMIPGTSTPLPPQTADTVAVDSHRVLRNTYWLLALSMLPTIAGALAGMQLNFIALFKAAPIMTPLLMFGVMIGSLFVVTRLRDSAWGVLALFGFTFIAGLMLTPILTVAAGFRNGGQLVALSGGLTAAVFFARRLLRRSPSGISRSWASSSSSASCCSSSRRSPTSSCRFRPCR
jgi:FtsH-binding integral membrane protein